MHLRITGCGCRWGRGRAETNCSCVHDLQYFKNSGAEGKANVVCHLRQVYFSITEQSSIEGAINVYM
jgi:hypothetical protein